MAYNKELDVRMIYLVMVAFLLLCGLSYAVGPIPKQECLQWGGEREGWRRSGPKGILVRVKYRKCLEWKTHEGYRAADP